MSIQNRLKNPIQKKAAALQDKPLQTDMIINRDYIDSLQQDSIDIAAISGRASEARENGSGANCSDETLLNFDGECYVKRHAFNATKQSKHTDILPPNVMMKRGILTAETPHFKTSKTGIDQWTVTFLNVDYGTQVGWIKQWIKGDPEEQKGCRDYKQLFIHPEAGYQVCRGHNVNGSSKVAFTATSLEGLSDIQKVEMMQQAMDMGGKFTRLDIFQDFCGDFVQLVELVTDVAETPRWSHLSVDPTQKVKDDVKGGLTLALGSRNSNQYWRLYDKGAEQGGSLNKWQRFENEIHRTYAHSMAILLVNSENVSQTITEGVFQKHLWKKDFPWWNEMCLVEVVLSTKREKMTLQRYITNKARVDFPKSRMLAEESNMTHIEFLTWLDAKVPDDHMSEPKKSALLLDEIRESLLDENGSIVFNSTKSIDATKTPDRFEVTTPPVTERRRETSRATNTTYSLTNTPQGNCPAAGMESDIQPELYDGSNSHPTSDLYHSPATPLDGRLST